ncbi:hypothetical protein PTKIN_Ptkin09bG0140700 [Pterospermum kingtungense]
MMLGKSCWQWLITLLIKAIPLKLFKRLPKTALMVQVLVVLMAVRTRGGDEAVFQSLYRAREVYRTRVQENTAVDKLASLFAECAIAEAEPSKAESLPCTPNGPSVASDAHGTSILAETGRMQIVLDAFSDGSSFICLQCGGLVSNHRKEEHYAYWCGNM